MVLSGRVPNFSGFIYIGIDIGQIFYSDPFPSVQLPTNVRTIGAPFIRIFETLTSIYLANPYYTQTQILNDLAQQIIPYENIQNFRRRRMNSAMPIPLSATIETSTSATVTTVDSANYSSSNVSVLSDVTLPPANVLSSIDEAIQSALDAIAQHDFQ